MVQLVARGDDLGPFLQQWQHRDLDRRQLGMESEHDTLLAAHLLFLVGVEQEGEQRAIHARRGLDHERHQVLLALLVEVRERLAAELRVLLEVEVGAIRGTHELAPAHRELVEEVHRALGIMGELVAGVLVQLHVLRGQAVAREPGLAIGDPTVVPDFVRGPALETVVRVHEELDLHLLELARAEDEVARRDLVAERLADLCDAEGQLASRRLQQVVEVDEDALRRLRPQVRDGGVLFHRPHERLEHQVELAWRRQLPLAAIRTERPPFSAVLARLPGLDGELVALRGRAVMRPVDLVHLVGAEAVLALAAVDHRIGEVLDVAARLPDHRVHQDRGIEAHHVVALLDEVAPPDALDVGFQPDAERAVVPARAGAAIDLARLEDEAAPLAQGNDDVHVHATHRRSPLVSDSRRTSRRNFAVRVGWPINRVMCDSRAFRSSASTRPSGCVSASSQPAARSRPSAATAAGLIDVAPVAWAAHASQTTPPSSSAGLANGYARPHSTQRSSRGRWPSTSRQRAPKQMATRGGPAALPSARSARGSGRQLRRTPTVSPRNTGMPKKRSSSRRASLPMRLSMAPPLPMRMPFCESCSTNTVARMSSRSGRVRSVSSSTRTATAYGTSWCVKWKTFSRTTSAT